MAKTDGHEDTFGAPSKGWPTFDKNGKRIREEAPATPPKPKTTRRTTK